MDNYSLIYKLVGSNHEITHVFKDKNDTISFIKCLHRGIAFIEGEPRTISSFSYFKIWLRNYDFDTGGGNYYDFEDNPDEPVKISDRPGFTPLDKDITNEILDECFFTSEDKNIYFDGEDLWVYGNKETFGKNSKIKGLITIIFKLQEKNESNIILYEDMEKEFNDGDYKDLKIHDIPYSKSRGLLKNRLTDIKNKYSLNTEIMHLSTQNIEILI